MNTKNKYNWKEIQTYYDDGHTYKDITKKFGASSDSIRKAGIRGDFKARTTSDALKQFNVKNPNAAKQIWTPERRKARSEQKKELYRKFPEKHPNRKLANNRLKMSYPEKLVYDWLTEEKISFEHQKFIKPYHADFCIGSLIIEIDG